MTAVIYARYSTDGQREESIEGQIRECTAYAEKNGITIVKHYIDRAISAKTDNRPEFQQLIKDSDKKLFDIVLVWKLDRFARNRYDSARYKTQLKKNGVKLMSATCVHQPDGFKDLLTGDFCCRRLFVLPVARADRWHWNGTDRGTRFAQTPGALLSTNGTTLSAVPAQWASHPGAGTTARRGSWQG